MCYTVPLAVSIITTIRGRQKKEPKLQPLNLMLYGGTLFGVIDHLWNGELFLIGENIASDLLLGCTITGTIFGGWGVILGIAKINPDLGYRMGILRSHQRR